MKYSNLPSGFSLREYQIPAVEKLISDVKDLIRGKLSREESGVFENALLLEMATGGGKTLTVGTVIDALIRMRNKSKALSEIFS